MRNRFGLRIREFKDYHKEKERLFSNVFMEIFRRLKSLSLLHIDTNNSSFIFASKTNYFSIGVLIDFTEFEVSEGCFIRGDYSNIDKIYELAEQVKAQIKEQKLSGGKVKSNIIFTTLQFENYTIDLLKALPNDIIFYTIEKNEKNEISFKKITPCTKDFFNKCIANEKKLISKRKELDSLKKSFKPTSNNLDHEAAIMNALKNGEADSFGF